MKRRLKNFALKRYIDTVGAYINRLGKINRKQPVLFVRNGGIGDIICTFPAAQGIKSRHPGCLYVYCCRPDFVCIPRASGLFDFCLGVRWNELLPVWLSGRFPIYSFTYADEQVDAASAEHLADEFCRNFDVEPSFRQPLLQVPPRDTVAAKKKVRFDRIQGPLIAIHTEPSWTIRKWPNEHWQTLIRKLQEFGYGNIIHLGGAHESFKISSILDLRGKLNLPTTIAAIKLARLFIGIDSGLLHIAGAVGTPSIGLFGPTNPEFRMPPKTQGVALAAKLDCQFCHHRVPRLHWQSGCPHNIECMSAIEPQWVLEKALAFLQKSQTLNRGEN